MPRSAGPAEIRKALTGLRPPPAGGKFLAGLICGEETVAVHVVEREVGGTRAAFASLTASHAGHWGLGVYVQMSNGQCVLNVPLCVLRNCRLQGSFKSHCTPCMLGHELHCNSMDAAKQAALHRRRRTSTSARR